MAIYSDYLKAHAERLGIPLGTLAQATKALNEGKKTGADKTMARMMLQHGRFTAEARAFIAAWK